MGVVNTLSGALTQANADPPMLNQAAYGNEPKAKQAYVAKAAGDSATSTLRCVRLPSNAILASVKCKHQAFGTGATADIGVYRTAANGGAVVDADCIADEFSTAAAKTTWTEAMSAVAAADIHKPLWQIAGLSADPQQDLDIVVTLGSTPGDQAANLAMLVEYFLG